MSDYPVIHNQADSRFEVKLEGQTAVLSYTMRGSTIFFTHTGVPHALEGRGIGTALVKTGLDYARAQNFKVVPYCWFVISFIERYREYQDLVKS